MWPGISVCIPMLERGNENNHENTKERKHEIFSKYQNISQSDAQNEA